MIQTLTQYDLAHFENVEPNKFEKSNFKLSFSFLPKEEKNAINTVYAFCSYIDDIVDSSPLKDSISIQKKLDRLSWWENEIENLYSHRINNKFFNSFSKIIDRFLIPKQHFLTLIDGVRRDLIQNRYQSFDELKDYCYCVASSVGLICIEIFGYKYEDTKNYAINLGYALQLTNIIRDIKADAQRDYIYLPQDELKKFNYSEDDLKNSVYNDNFVALMAYQTQRAKEFYHKARLQLHPDERHRVMSAEIMDAIYFRLLEKIELNDYDVYSQKIRVANSHKVMLALKHWLSIKLFIDRFKKN